jgi:beta-glucosidase
MGIRKIRHPMPAVAAGLILACGALDPGALSAAEPATVDPGSWPEVTSAVRPDPEIERAVEELLAAMSLADKVGQVIQPEINSVTPAQVKAYRLGSVLNGGGGWPGNRKKSTPADWLALADAFWEASMDTPEGGVAIPILWGLDAVHGHGNVIGATLFPHNIGLGAANDPDLIREIGRVTAREVAVTGQDWDFGPTIAVARDDRWGRTYESYSEDPAIVRAYAAAMVEGLQGRAGDDAFLDGEHIIACAKHFLGDGGTDGGRDQGDNVAGEAELRDLHGAGYASAIAAGVQTVMASFSSWQGAKLHGHRGLLTDVLKGRMGFDGFVVGDWNAHGQVPGCSNESCAVAFNAGIDMFMVPQDWQALYESTLAQVKAGEIAAERLDDAVRRILRVKMRAGLFERGKPSSRPLAGRTELFGSPEHRAVARRAVRHSLVLLKNNGGLLPLSPGARVLVAGDGADDIGKQTGGWTITWQGTGNSNDEFPGATSIWGGIREAVDAAGGTAVLSPDGSYQETPDVAIVVFGEDPYAEFVGDRSTVDFRPEKPVELLRSLQASGIPVVSVFLSGRPLWVNPELNASDAFVAAWLPGTEGGGVADVLFAAADGSVRHDFTGRLSFSWPKEATQAVLNRGDADYDPLFAYGYGLSYAEDVELAELPEEMPEIVVASRTVYFDRGPVAPWRLFVGDEANWQIMEAGGITTTQGSENLTLRAVDREAQEDARAARWSGDAQAAVYIQAGETVDLSRESNGELVVAVDLMIEQAPGETVLMRMGCGVGCSGILDVSELVAGLAPGSWSTLRVHLNCFEKAGADMKRIDMPFGLATAGELALRFADVRLESGSEMPKICPPAWSPPPAE